MNRWEEPKVAVGAADDDEVDVSVCVAVVTAESVAAMELELTPVTLAAELVETVGNADIVIVAVPVVVSVGSDCALAEECPDAVTLPEKKALPENFGDTEDESVAYAVEDALESEDNDEVLDAVGDQVMVTDGVNDRSPDGVGEPEVRADAD